MSVIVNDLSISGQYQTTNDFVTELKQLLALRAKSSFVSDRLLCSRSLVNRLVTTNESFQQAVMRSNDRNFARLVLSWIGNSGPFWDDERTDVEDDYFEHDQTDVTDSGLGEAARRLQNGVEVETFSFTHQNYCRTPLLIIQGIADEPVSNIELINHWTLEELEKAMEARAPKIRSWGALQSEAHRRFNNLRFSEECFLPLSPQPFHSYAAQRICELLGVLNTYIDELAADGTPTERNNELIRNHFSGTKAWFTDESDRNKRDFERELTFKFSPDTQLFCPFHGKIKTPQYRIHFEWPPQRKEKLRVCYIGPKITKG